MQSAGPTAAAFSDDSEVELELVEEELDPLEEGEAALFLLAAVMQPKAGGGPSCKIVPFLSVDSAPQDRTARRASCQACLGQAQGMRGARPRESRAARRPATP
eukprot:1686787-Pyramimonas_sp.AAC.1